MPLKSQSIEAAPHIKCHIEIQFSPSRRVSHKCVYTVTLCCTYYFSSPLSMTPLAVPRTAPLAIAPFSTASTVSA